MKKERTRCESQRDKKGRFIETNGSTRYKVQQRDGKRLGIHVIAWQDYNKRKLPSGWCVHHKDENKKNNNINNLEAMPIAKHTKMHFDKYYKTNNIWNKGKTTHFGNNEVGHKVLKRTVIRRRLNIFNKQLDSSINIWKLKDIGSTPTQISKELNISIDKVNHRWKSFNNSYLSWSSSGRYINE